MNEYERKIVKLIGVSALLAHQELVLNMSAASRGRLEVKRDEILAGLFRGLDQWIDE